MEEGFPSLYKTRKTGTLDGKDEVPYTEGRERHEAFRSENSPGVRLVLISIFSSWELAYEGMWLLQSLSLVKPMEFQLFPRPEGL